MIGAREKVLNGIRSRIFPVKDKNLTPESEQAPETAPEPTLNSKVFDTPKTKEKYYYH